VKLSIRLILLFMLAALLPATLVGLLATQRAAEELERSIEANFQGIALAKAHAIDLDLTAHVEEARVLAAHPIVLEAARAGNEAWRGQDEDQARATIQRLDRAWIEASKQSPRADAVFAHPLSDYLRVYQARDTDRYGEIFLTDRLGASVAMTNRLSDYDQSDEQWWSDPVSGGADGLFIDDRGLDESVGALILGVVVPVVDQGEILGVLKINYKVSGILQVVEPTGQDLSDHVLLARGDGSILAGDQGSGNEQHVSAEAEVRTPIHNRVPTEGAIKGVSGERWEPLGWKVVVLADRAAMLAPAKQVRQQALLISGGGLAFAALLALLMARSITGPLRRLERGAERVGAGDLHHRVALGRTDELGVLSRAFDAMTGQLRETLASRDELDREVKERQRAERRLRRTLDELARSNQELEQFAYVASHDLQEPLRKVRSFGDRLAKRASDTLDERSLDYLQRMQSASERMQTLIDALLSYSRVSSRAKPFEPVELDELLDGVLSDLEVRCEATGARIERDPLPSISGDANQLRQLFQNLIGNALKFQHPDRSPVIEIRSEARSDPDGWRITVRDNGIGFEPEQAARIFEPFHRLHSRSAYPGTGIGLAICAKIVQRHGGTLQASATPGEGARFEVNLPSTIPSGDRA
jgi:signal transduction histidine kinase